MLEDAVMPMSVGRTVFLSIVVGSVRAMVLSVVLLD